MITKGVHLIPTTGSACTCFLRKHVPQIILLSGLLISITNVIFAESGKSSSSLTCISSLNLSIPLSGSFELEPVMFVLGVSPEDAVDFELDIEGPLGSVVTCNQVGQILKVVITNPDPEEGNKCWSYLKVEDKLDPQILDCEDIDTLCYVDPLEWPIEEFIEVLDNCSSGNKLHIWYSDEIIPHYCPEDVVQEIKRTWIVEDAYGNSATCMQSIFLERFDVEDVEFPPDVSVYCPDGNTDPDSTGYPTINGELIDPFCEVIVFHQDTELPLGCDGSNKIMRLWTVMDWCMESMEDSIQIIYVLDTIPPEIEMLPDTTIGTDSLLCKGTYTIPGVETTDSCADNDESIQVKVIVDGLPYYLEGDKVKLDLGNHTVSYVATDPCGNRDTITHMVFVEDDTPPMIDCGEEGVIVTQIPLMNNDLVTVPAHAFHFYAFDNCMLDTILIRRIEDSCGIPQDTVFGDKVTFCCDDILDSVRLEIKVLDIYGNADSCQFLVDIKEPGPPKIVCMNDTVYVDQDGMAMADVEAVVDTAYDHCGLGLDTVFIDLDLEDLVFDCEDVGEVFMVDVVVIDLEGDRDTCMAMITVLDTIPPEPVCMDTTLYLDEDGEAVLMPEDIDGGSSDNCEDPDFDLDMGLFDCGHLGINSVKLYVLDGGMNSDSCVAMVTVMDTIPPEAICMDTTLYLDENGEAMLIPEDIDDGSTDNCDIVMDSLSQDMFDCTHLGVNNVKLYVTDEGMNSDSCISMVTVLDTIPPEIIGCFADTVLMCADNNDPLADLTAFGDPDDLFAMATDNCMDNFPDSTHIDTIFMNANSMDNDTIVRRILVFDESGLSDSCIQNIIVSPTFPCPVMIHDEVDISGLVYRQDKSAMPDVRLKGGSVNWMDAMTDRQGKYRFNEVQIENSFSIIPEKIDDWLNGITVNDVILVYEHILGFNVPENPYMHIAADVDRSGDVTVFDVFELHKLLLQVKTDVENNSVWRFVPAGFKFSDEKYPLHDQIPGSIQLDNYSQQTDKQNFVAIKVGDMDLDAVLYKSLPVADSPVTLSIQDKMIEQADMESLVIEVLPEGLQSIQFGLNLSPGVQYKGYRVLNGSELSDVKVHYHSNEHRLHIIAYTLNRGLTPELELQFTFNKGGYVSDHIDLSGEYPGLSFSEDGRKHEIHLNFEVPEQIAEQTIAIYPNPFTEYTMIDLTGLGNDVQAATIYDSRGRLIHRFSFNDLQAGQAIKVRNTFFDSSGLYVLQVKSGAAMQTYKLIYID